MSRSRRAGQVSDKAADAYQQARQNEYVQRLLTDEELHDTLKEAYGAAKTAYGRISGNGDGPVKAVTSDRKVQRDLRNAAESLKEATEQFRAPKKKGHGFRNFVVLAAVAGGVTLAVSEGARKAVLDKVFGAEEEFEYTSTTTSDTPPSTNGKS